MLNALTTTPSSTDRSQSVCAFSAPSLRPGSAGLTVLSAVPCSPPAEAAPHRIPAVPAAAGRPRHRRAQLCAEGERDRGSGGMSGAPLVSA